MTRLKTPLKIMHAALAVMFLLCSPLAPCQSMPGMPGMDDHHHHDDAPMSAEQLGTVHFPVSCPPQTQAGMQRGVALLHSFGYTEAEHQFREVVKQDPNCAMAHWGVAMTQYQELWGRPSAEMLKVGAEQMGKAEALSSGVTPREKMYIDALNGFFAGAGKDFPVAADNYAAAMKKLHESYPNDVEAAAFYALAVLASVAPNDTSLTKERTALAVLVPLFQQNPEHPGLAHYIIHTCDTPQLAAQGLDAAEVYAKIAPSSAHALHMPGHIFARLGMWPQDIQSNLASVAASEKSEATHEPGAAHQLHADEFLIYAYLQVGQDAKARQLVQQMRSISDRMAAMPGMDDMKDSGPWFDNEVSAIYLLEMHDWKGAEALKPEPGSKDMADLIVVWANGIGAARAHDLKASRAALADMDAQLAAMKKGPRAYLVEGLMVPRDEMAGWNAYADGHDNEAIALLRKAADQQDKLGQREVDIPAREMLADLLLQLHRPKEALAEYKIALKLSPNRLNGLLNAGEAAEQAGDKSEAAAFYAQAAKNTDDGAHSSRPELKHAVDFSRVQTAAVSNE